MRFNSKLKTVCEIKMFCALVLFLVSTGSAWSQVAATGNRPETIRITNELVRAAQKEGKLHIRHSTPPETAEAIAATFKKKYGIDVVVERRVAGEATNTFMTEERAGRHIVDVHINTDRRGALALVKEGLYAPYKVGNDAQYDASSKIENYAVAPYMSSSVLGYNTDRLTPADAERLFSGTWTGLLDPRFKNRRIGILSPLATSATSLWFWALSQSPKYGESFLRAVAAADPVIYPTQAVGEEALHAGEVDVLIGEIVEPAQSALMRGAAIAWVYPDILPATPAVFHFLSAKAPHPNAARLYLAWTLSEEGATSISMDGGRYPSIKAKVPQNPKIQAALKAAKWYKPYPDNVRFTPSVADILEHEDKYRKQMIAMFNMNTRR